MEKFRVELLKPENPLLDQIAKLDVTLPKEWDQNYTVSQAEILKAVEELIINIKNLKKRCFFIQENKVLISFLIFEINSNGVLKINSLWTNPDFRKKGIATRQKKNLESWALKNNVKKICTTVAKENLNMQNINAKLGYRVTSFRMEKDL